MTFSEALGLLKFGQKIRRKHWKGYWEYEPMELQKVNDDGIGRHRGNAWMIIAYLEDGTIAPAQAYQEDLLSSDWERVE